MVEQMTSVMVPIRISADEYLKYYSGSAKHITALDTQGRRIRFPAGILQKFVTRDGLKGVFEIHFDARGKFVSVNRLN